MLSGILKLLHPLDLNQIIKAGSFLVYTPTKVRLRCKCDRSTRLNRLVLNL
jgi:hypothetical protein